MKTRRLIVEMSFQAKFRRKASESQEISRKTFALLLHNTVHLCDTYRPFRVLKVFLSSLRPGLKRAMIPV